MKINGAFGVDFTRDITDAKTAEECLRKVGIGLLSHGEWFDSSYTHWRYPLTILWPEWRNLVSNIELPCSFCSRCNIILPDRGDFIARHLPVRAPAPGSKARRPGLRCRDPRGAP